MAATFVTEITVRMRINSPALVDERPEHQKLSGWSSIGVQRVFLTTERNDWLDA